MGIEPDQSGAVYKACQEAARRNGDIPLDRKDGIASKAHENLCLRYVGVESPGPGYVRQVVRRAWLDEVRRVRTAVPLGVGPDEPVAPAVDVERDIAMQQVLRTLDAGDAADRDAAALLRRLLGGTTIQELVAAELLPGADEFDRKRVRSRVEHRVRRARDRARQILGGE